MLVKKILGTAALALAVFAFTGPASYAQQYYNGYYYDPYAYNNNYNTQSYYNPGYQQVYYPPAQNGYYYQPVADPYAYNQPVYDPYYNQNEGFFSKSKVTSAIKYGAIGAGAGYLFSGEGKKGRNTAIGAGLGAALGLLLNK